MKVFAGIFEVMDKEPSLFGIWLFALVLGVGGFLLCRRRPWLLAVVLPLALVLHVGHLFELHDPQVGPHVLSEAGRSYFVSSYVATAVSVILPCLGALSRRRKLT